MPGDVPIADNARPSLTANKIQNTLGVYVHSGGAGAQRQHVI